MDKFLTINPYSRPGTKLKEVKAIVLHWTSRADQNADIVWKFFETDCPKIKKYSSAHYIIDNDTVLHCIPDNEMAYHAGSSTIDPSSGKIYTDFARTLLGKYASNPTTLSPNQCTIGIEMVPEDDAGTFSKATLEQARILVSKLLIDTKLSIDDVTTHKNLVGWKFCPKYWVDHPEKFEEFKKSLELV